MRRKRHTGTQLVTAPLLGTGGAGTSSRQSRSVLTSPSQLVLNEVTELGSILRPLVPPVEQAVRLNGSVQYLDTVLRTQEYTSSRRSARNANKAAGASVGDYKRLHERGWR